MRLGPSPPQPPAPSSDTGATTAGPTRGRRVVRYGLVLLTAVLVVDALVGEKGLLEIVRARRQHAALERSLAEVRASNARLRGEIHLLREDPQALEDLARRELGFIKPGEKVFIVRDLDNAAR
jgi:cell division protein FtsB